MAGCRRGTWRHGARYCRSAPVASFLGAAGFPVLAVLLKMRVWRQLPSAIRQLVVLSKSCAFDSNNNKDLTCRSCLSCWTSSTVRSGMHGLVNRPVRIQTCCAAILCSWFFFTSQRSLSSPTATPDCLDGSPLCTIQKLIHPGTSQHYLRAVAVKELGQSIRTSTVPARRCRSGVRQAGRQAGCAYVRLPPTRATRGD